MTDPRTDPLVLIVVPNGTHRAEPLVRAVLNAHPSWDVLALWAGDPHLRPVLEGAASWFDRVELDPEWQRTGRRIAELLGVEPHPTNPPRVAN